MATSRNLWVLSVESVWSLQCLAPYAIDHGIPPNIQKIISKVCLVRSQFYCQQKDKPSSNGDGHLVIHFLDLSYLNSFLWLQKKGVTVLQVFFEALTWPLRGKVVTRKVQVSTFTGKVNNYDHIISESWKLWSSVCVCVCVHHLERCKACYYQEDARAYDGVSVQRTTSQCSCDMDWGPSIQVPAFSEISQLISRVCSLIKLLLSHSNSSIFIQTWTLERVLSLNYI